MTHPSDIAGLSERLRDGYAYKRPFPLNRVDRGRVVAPIYAIDDHDLQELLSEIDALQARVKELEVQNLALRALVKDGDDVEDERDRAQSERDSILKTKRSTTQRAQDFYTQLKAAESRALRAEQQRDEAVERCAKVAESFAPATQDMMSTTISDYCDSIAAAIRQLAATSDPKETTNG